MARQNVGNPKFYVDYLSYWNAKGNIESVEIASPTPISGDFRKLIGLNPSDFIREDIEYAFAITIKLKDGMYIPRGTDDKFFLGLFGHNFYSTYINGVQMTFKDHNGNVVLDTDELTIDEICNWRWLAADDTAPETGDLDTDTNTYNGWSMGEWTGGDSDSFYTIELAFTSIVQDYDAVDNTLETVLGSLGFGYAFQMPHSPDLKLTMTRDYDGIQEQTTRGGSTLTQINYHGPSDWAGYPAWELYTSNSITYIDDNYIETRVSAKGRRVWDLKFSYIDYKSIMPILENLWSVNPTDSETEGGYDDTDIAANGVFDTDIRRDSSFMGVVMEKTIGGALPFIFQPDGNNNSPDQFAICKLDQSSFKFKQVAHNVYDISLKIREVW